MIEENTIIKELLLHDEDFPDNYIHMAHPEDYKEVSNFVPQFIMHSHFGRHNRLIVRAAWKAQDDTLIPMSFVCDTGAPSHIYLSNKALFKLHSKSLLLRDERDTSYANIHIDNTKTFPATIEETPHAHKDANILGLKCLKKLNMHLKDDSFSFNDNFIYL
jgi:hypothetical protein